MENGDRSTLITGGGRGLGRAIALGLSRPGARIGLVARTAGELEETAEAVRELGGEARGFVADVLDTTLKRAIDRFADWTGGLDTLVCAAGRLRGIGPLGGADEGWWGDVETALRGVPRSIFLAWPLLRRSSSATISVLVGPGHASEFAFAAGYAAAQAGLVRLVEGLATELKPDGIRIYAVNPGLVPTAMIQHLLESPEGRRWLPGITEAFAEGKEVDAEVIASMVAWLAEARPVELSGRVVPALATPEILETRLARIQAEDLLKLRLR